MHLRLAVCCAMHTCRACCTSCHRKFSANSVSHRSESWLVSSSLSQLLLTCDCAGPTNRSSCCITTQRLAPVAVPMLWPQHIYLQSLTRTLFVAGGEFDCTILFGRSMHSRGGCCTSFAHPIAQRHATSRADHYSRSLAICTRLIMSIRISATTIEMLRDTYCACSARQYGQQLMEERNYTSLRLNPFIFALPFVVLQYCGAEVYGSNICL